MNLRHVFAIDICRTVLNLDRKTDTRHLIRWSLFCWLAFSSSFAIPGMAQEAATTPTVADSQARFLSLQSRFQKDTAKRVPADHPSLVADFEEWISSSPNSPRLGLAMFDLASLYSMNSDRHAKPLGDSLERSIAWFRKARQIAPRGGPLWTNVSLKLAYQLRRQANSVRALPEARAVIDEIREYSQEIPDIDLQIAEQMVWQSVKERNFDDAERICRDLLALSSQASPLSTGIKNANLLRGCQQIAANGLLNGVMGGSPSERKTKKWVDQFAADFPQHDFVRDTVARSREQLPSERIRLEEKKNQSSPNRRFILGSSGESGRSL